MSNLYSLKDEARRREDWQKWTDISEYELRLNQQRHEQWLKDMEVKQIKTRKWFAKLDIILFVSGITFMTVWYLTR
jgi:hypothetical protein